MIPQASIAMSPISMMSAGLSPSPVRLGDARTPGEVLEVYKRYSKIWEHENHFECQEIADLIKTMQSKDQVVFIQSIQPIVARPGPYFLYRQWYFSKEWEKIPDHLAHQADRQFARTFLRYFLYPLRRNYFGRDDGPSDREIPPWDRWPHNKKTAVADWIRKWLDFSGSLDLRNPYVYFLARALFPDDFRFEPRPAGPSGDTISAYLRPPEIRAVHRPLALPSPVSSYPDYRFTEPTVYFWRLQKELRLPDLEDASFLKNLMTRLQIKPLEGNSCHPLEAVMIDVPEDHPAVSALVEGWVRLCVPRQKDSQTPPDFPNQLCARIVFKENPEPHTYRIVAIRDYFVKKK